MASRTIRPLAPVDLVRTIARHAASRSDPAFAFEEGVWMALRTPSGPATVRFTHDGDITAEAWGEGADSALDAAPGLCGADDDRSGFSPDHRLVDQLDRTHHGLRVTRSPDVTSALLRVIPGQRVTGKQAKQSYLRMARALGEPAPGPRPLLLPPAAALVAASGYTRFHPWEIERTRAETMIRAAARAKRLDEAAAMQPEEARRRLTAVRGVGDWTVGKLGTTTLGDPDAVPTGDYHLPNTVAYALAGEDRADDARMLDLLEPFRPHRGRVVMLLEAAHVGAPKFGPRTAIRSIDDA